MISLQHKRKQRQLIEGVCPGNVPDYSFWLMVPASLLFLGQGVGHTIVKWPTFLTIIKLKLTSLIMT